MSVPAPPARALLALALACGVALLWGSGPAAAQTPHDAPSPGLPSVTSAPPAVQQQVRRGLQGPDGAGKDGPLSTLDRRLAALYYQHEAHGPAGVRRLARPEVAVQQTERARHYSPVSADGRSVALTAIASGRPAALRTALRRLGLQGGHIAGNAVSGRLPIAALKAAAQLSSLRGALPTRYRTHVGRVGSEADTAHAAYQGRAELNVDGSGSTVCALSDSYDNPDANTTPSQDAAQDVADGDLPSTVDVLADSVAGTDEGRAMLQLIHDIAPGADLGFHTASGGLGTFVDGIRALADPNRGNCDIIVDDIGYNIEPFYQDGPVSNVVDSVVAEGIPYFSSAGNDGDNAYTAPFRNSGNPGVLSPSAVAHDFDPGPAVDTLQQITIQQGGDFGFFTFQWSDPSALVSGSAAADTDLDVALVNDTLGVVAQSALNSDGDGVGVPFESLRFTNNGTVDTDNDGTPDTRFHLVIEKDAGPDPDEVKYIYSGTGFTIVDDYGETTGPTIYGHPMAEGAQAVAAAPFYNTDAYQCLSGNCPSLESFSSKGGIPILFDQSGTRIPETVRQKPNVTGVDGVDNTFFGTDTSRDGDSYPNFFGTSAAAPNVAAIAALVREVHPEYTPSEVYTQIESNAIDVTSRFNSRTGTYENVPAGVDVWSGHGLAQATGADLPVELTRFDAAAAGEGALLTWATASETNNAGFAVEHRYEDEAFTELAFKEGAGTTTESQRYRHRTPALRVGTHTFRLKQVDVDGSTTYSDEVTLDVALSGAYSVSSVAPNPVRHRSTVAVTVQEAQPVTATVYNVLGQQVARLHDGPMPAQTPTTLRLGASLPSGVYFLRVEGASFSTTQKFVRLQ